MAVYSLRRWSVVRDPYKAPEVSATRLAGLRDDAKHVTTSIIKKVNGREITTQSGSVYILEDIDPDYLKYLNDTGEHYNPENPIRVKVT